MTGPTTKTFSQGHDDGSYDAQHGELHVHVNLPGVWSGASPAWRLGYQCGFTGVQTD